MLVCMKTKNMRELEKRWADQAKKAAKPQATTPKKTTAPKEKSREDANQSAAGIAPEATEK
jgi:hypothetical protein